MQKKNTTMTVFRKKKERKENQEKIATTNKYEQTKSIMTPIGNTPQINKFS